MTSLRVRNVRIWRDNSFSLSSLGWLNVGVVRSCRGRIWIWLKATFTPPLATRVQVTKNEKFMYSFLLHIQVLLFVVWTYSLNFFTCATLLVCNKNRQLKTFIWNCCVRRKCWGAPPLPYSQTQEFSRMYPNLANKGGFLLMHVMGFCD